MNSDIILVSCNNGKNILLTISEDIKEKYGLCANDIIKEIIAEVGGGGGGTAISASAGGIPSKKLKKIKKILHKRVKEETDKVIGELNEEELLISNSIEMVNKIHNLMNKKNKKDIRIKDLLITAIKLEDEIQVLLSTLYFNITILRGETNEMGC